MTLLPIVYTSVLIFSSLLLFIIIISYISYKAKLHGRSTRNVECARGFNQPLVIRPAYINNRVGKPIQLQVQNTFRESRIPNITQLQLRDVINLPIPYMDSNRNKPVENEKYYNKNAHKKYIEKNEMPVERKLKRYETQSFKNRLEIMNTTDSFIKTQEREKDQNVISYHNSNIDEINLINYYSDNSELDFVALSAQRANRAI